MKAAWSRLSTIDLVALGLLVLLALASLVVAIAPEPQPRPLLVPGDIAIESGFIRTDPPRAFEIRRGMRDSRWFAVWRNWNAEQGSVAGSAASAAFEMPAYLSVAYQGFAGQSANRLWLECTTGGEVLEVANARTNTQWSEVLLRRPGGWCAGGKARLRAHGDGDQYLAFSTPFEVSALAWMKAGIIGLFGPALLLFALVAGFVVASARALTRRFPSGDPLAWGLIGFGVFGYASFFLFDASRPLGQLVGAMGLGWAMVGLLALRRADSARDEALAIWRGPLFAWAIVAIAYLMLLFAGDNGAGPWLANARFLPVRWSTDNQLPMLIGEHLARLDLKQLDIAPWQVSDRTPLAYGVHAWLRSVLALLARGDDGPHLAWQFHTLIGVVLNTAWAPVCWALLRRAGIGTGIACAAFATLALLPFCLFNSLYIWPKLIGASFALLACWLLLVEPPASEPAGMRARWLQAALLSALALLCHGGTVFGIVAMLLLALARKPRPRLATLAIAGAGAVAMLLPWMLWGRLVQPNGNALVKSVFGGTFGFDERHMGVLDTLARSYSSLTLEKWWSVRLSGLESLLLRPIEVCGMGEMAAATNAADSWRIADFLALAPSLKFLWLGLLVALVPAWRRAAPTLRPALTLIAVGVLGVTVSLFTAWDCQMIHQQSYQSVLAIALGLLLLLCAAPRFYGLAAMAASIAYGLVVWVALPLPGMLRIDPAAIAGLLLLVAWLASRGARAWRAQA